MRTVSVFLLMLLALGALAPIAFAQPPASPDPPQTAAGRRDGVKSGEWKDKDIRDMVTTVMMVRMSRELGLNDEQTVMLVRNFANLRDTLGRLSEEREQLIGKLRSAVEKGAPDDQIQPLLDQLMSVDVQREKVQHEAFEKAGADLTVTQKAKLYIFVQEFEGHMRKLIQKAREMGGDRMMRFPGGAEGPSPGMADRYMRRGIQPPEGEQPGQRPILDELHRRRAVSPPPAPQAPAPPAPKASE